MKRKPVKSAATKSDDVFEIKSLLDYENRNGADFYLVEWAGYSLEEATWEPRTNFFSPSAEVVRRMKELKEKSGELPTENGKEKVKRKLKRSSVSTTDLPPNKKRSIAQKKNDNVAPIEDTLPPTESSGKRPSGESEKLTASETPIAVGATSSAVHSTTQKDQKDQPKGSTSKGSENVTKGKSVGDVIVKSIRQDTAHELCAILTNGTTDTRRPIAEVRKEYPDQLIEFLLNRVQFRSNYSGGTTSSAKPAAAAKEGATGTPVPQK